MNLYMEQGEVCVKCGVCMERVKLNEHHRKKESKINDESFLCMFVNSTGTTT